MSRSLVLALFFLGITAPCFGQSGTKGGVFIPRRNPANLNTEIPGERPLYALGGDDVTTVRAGTPKRGSLEHQAVFDGQVYLFETAAAKKAFTADTMSQAPVLSGMSVVS